VTVRHTIDELLGVARRGLRRLTPAEAHRAAQDGAVLVDVRSEDERRRQGGLVPGALHHPLFVVHWRLDPDVPTSNPKLPLNEHVILLCREGYSSSLAAALLREIGFEHATDVIGGVDAWQAAGLPLEPYASAEDGRSVSLPKIG
jgi:rhodanese-related sulfurtransferase